MPSTSLKPTPASQPSATLKSRTVFYVCGMAARIRFLWLTLLLPKRLAALKFSVSHSHPLPLAWVQAHYDAQRYQLLLRGHFRGAWPMGPGDHKAVTIRALTWLRSKPFGKSWADSIHPHLRD
jgi:hypothetical protein